MKKNALVFLFILSLLPLACSKNNNEQQNNNNSSSTRDTNSSRKNTRRTIKTATTSQDAALHYSISQEKATKHYQKLMDFYTKLYEDEDTPSLLEETAAMEKITALSKKQAMLPIERVKAIMYFVEEFVTEEVHSFTSQMYLLPAISLAGMLAKLPQQTMICFRDAYVRADEKNLTSYKEIKNSFDQNKITSARNIYLEAAKACNIQKISDYFEKEIKLFPSELSKTNEDKGGLEK